MTLTPGSEFTIDAGGSDPVGADQISSSRAFVLYVDGMRTVDDDESIGAEEAMPAGRTGADVAVLSATKGIGLVLDTGGGEIYYVVVVTISGTTLTYVDASELSVSNSDISSTSLAIVSMSSSAFVVVFADSNQAYASYYTVSGNTITEESQVIFDQDILNATTVKLDSSIKAIVAYTDSDDSNIMKMCVLSISGATISAGTPVNVEASDVSSSGENGDLILAEISTTQALLGYANHTDEILKAVVITISGTVPSSNTPEDIESWSSAGGEFIRHLGIIPFSTTVFGLFYGFNNVSKNPQIAEVAVSGTSVTDSGSVELTTDVLGRDAGVAFTSTSGVAVYEGTIKGIIVTASAAVSNDLDIAPMRKPADVDADGTSIYLAMLNSSTFPVLIKIAAALDADGSIVFNPGAGSDIGVQAGNFNGSVIWIGGTFDGTNVIEKTIDAGSSFVVKDPATFGGVVTFAVGPDSDDKILVIDDNEDIHETIDDGSNWVTHQTAVGIASKALARLDKNTQEIVVGNVAATNINIQYSVNSGDDLQDFSTGFPEQDVSGVTVG